MGGRILDEGMCYGSLTVAVGGACGCDGWGGDWGSLSTGALSDGRTRGG